MIVLFQPIYLQTPHFETELELMENHIQSGDTVHVLCCDGELLRCFANPNHLDSKCILCRSTRESGISQLSAPVIRHSYDTQPNHSNPSLPLFKDIEELKNYHEDNYEYGICAASSLITALNRDHEFDTIYHKSKIRAEIDTCRTVRNTIENIFRQMKFDKVYIYNGRFSSALPIVNFCERNSIPYTTHERGGMLSTYCTLNDSIFSNLSPITKEIHKVWEKLPLEKSKKIGHQFFTDRRSRIEHCWHSFTKKQFPQKLPSNFDSALKNISIFNSTIEEFAANRHRKDPWRFFTSECNAIETICSFLKNEINYHIYLRIHPNLQGASNSQLKAIWDLKEKHTNLTIIPPDSTIDSYALMDASHTIITFGSTMGAEATYWGKPSILLGKAFYESLDCCYIPNDREELYSLLTQSLPAKSIEGALRYGCWDLMRGTPFRHYSPIDLKHGKFKGANIGPSTRSLVLARLLQLFEPSMYPSLWRELRKKF